MKSIDATPPDTASSAPTASGALHGGFAIWMWRCAVVLPHPGLDPMAAPADVARPQTAQSRLAPSRSVASSFEKLRRMMPRSVASE